MYVCLSPISNSCLASREQDLGLPVDLFFQEEGACSVSQDITMSAHG